MNSPQDPRTAFLESASKAGWEIVFEDENGFQLKRGKRYSSPYASCGLILFILGIGIVILIFGFIDYLSRKDELVYIAKDKAFHGKDALASVTTSP